MLHSSLGKKPFLSYYCCIFHVLPKKEILSLKRPQVIIAIIVQLVQEMKGQLFCFLWIMGLVCATGRPFAPNLGHGVDLGPAGINGGLQSRQTTMNMSSEQGEKSGGTETMKKEEAAAYKEVNKLGSSPPSCEHKCFGCVPCEAIQVPTTNGRVGVQYANYEPEGWKCKCGPTFYTP